MIESCNEGLTILQKISGVIGTVAFALFVLTIWGVIRREVLGKPAETRQRDRDE